MRRGDARTSTRQTNAIAARFRRVASSPRRAAVVRERENRGETTSRPPSRETSPRRREAARVGDATRAPATATRPHQWEIRCGRRTILKEPLRVSASTRLNKEGEMRAMFAVLRGARARRRKMGKSRVAMDPIRLTPSRSGRTRTFHRMTEPHPSFNKPQDHLSISPFSSRGRLRFPFGPPDSQRHYRAAYPSPRGE